LDARERELRFLEMNDSRAPCREWLERLESSKNSLYGTILARLDRVEGGNFGDCKNLKGGLWELRIDVGPGYRVYFGEDDDIVVLLLGGTKQTQDRDIETAREYWSNYNA
jgi:putative addiction module killer protein